MGDKTGIQWTEATWNPVTGCTKVSQGCKNCYAETMALRLQKMGQANYVNGFALTLQPHMLELPLRWKRPRLIFVNSMSDIFHDDVPLIYIQQVFAVMEKADQHTFQILTKRAQRLAQLAPYLPWPPNVWMGVSVEDAAAKDRIDHLRQVPAAVRFLSCEPLIGPLGAVDLDGIHWVIGGGESGQNARPVHPNWARELRDQCVTAGTHFFWKQWGEWMPEGQESHHKPLGVPLGTVLGHPVYRVGKHKAGRLLDGREWNEIPEAIT
jgi:protein gp37